MKEDLAFRRSKRLAHTRAFFGSPTVQPPPPRNITQEMLQTLAGQRQTAPGQFALESTYQPKYNELQLRLLEQSLFGTPEQRGQQSLQQQASTSGRGADISDVERFGLRGNEALLRSNPFLAKSLGLLNNRTANSGVLGTLNTQAQNELDLNGALSPAESRSATQAFRAGESDRGVLMGDSSAAAEVLNRDAARRARLGQTRQFATGVGGLNQQQNDFVGRASQINATSLSDPWLAILGRSSGAGGGGGGAAGGRQMIGTGSQLFDPTNPYAQDIYNTNYNAQASANISNANNKSASNNANLGAAAAVASAVIIAI